MGSVPVPNQCRKKAFWYSKQIFFIWIKKVKTRARYLRFNIWLISLHKTPNVSITIVIFDTRGQSGRDWYRRIAHWMGYKKACSNGPWIFVPESQCDDFRSKKIKNPGKWTILPTHTNIPYVNVRRMFMNLKCKTKTVLWKLIYISPFQMFVLKFWSRMVFVLNYQILNDFAYADTRKLLAETNGYHHSIPLKKLPLASSRDALDLAKL
jgi:hypothetical protein